MAAGFAATVGVGSAAAVPGTVDWSDGRSKFTRTVSNTTPVVGETVTVSTKFERTGTPVEYIQAVKDLHPTCLTYVSGNRSNPEIAADYTRVTGSWPVYPNVNPKSQTFSFDYLVTANCARETPLMTTMHYSGSLGSGTYTDKGPTITVAKDATTTALAPVPTPVLTGQAVTLTATVTGAAQGSPVEFYDGATKLGEGALDASGVGTFAWTPSTAGARSLTAKFPGTAIANSSQSAPQNVQVDAPVDTGVSVTAPGTAETGTPVTLSAAVTPPGAQGAVQFKVDGIEVGAPVPVTNDAAALSHTFNAAGSFEVTAEFTGAAGFRNSSASAQNVTVSDPDVGTSISVQVPGSATTGVEVDLVAELTPQNVSGTVQFTDNGAPIGAPVSVVNGVATLPHTFTSTGAHNIGAAFTGAPGFADASASSPASIVVSDPDQQTTTTVSVPATAQTGLPVNLEATVYPETSGGTVQFKVDGADIGSPIPVSDGAAALPWTFDAAGSFAVTAVYSGATGFEGSTSESQSTMVSDPDVTTSLTVSESVPTSAETGDSVDLTATVDPSSAQGEVQFSVNGSPVGVAVPVSAGSASLPYVFGAAGVYAVTAEFTGAAGFTNSSAPARNVTVTDPVVPDTETTTTVTAPVAATMGVETMLSVAVQAQSGEAAPTGSVQFLENGSPIGVSMPLVNGSASLAHTFSAVGTRQISAVYTADTGFLGSTSAERPVVVSAPDPSDVESSVEITSTQAPTVGTPYVLKAQVTGAESLPGTVQFFDGGVEIGAPVPVIDGFAELTHTFAEGGPRRIHAVYSGGAGVAGSTSDEIALDVVDSDGGDTGGAGSLDFGSLGSLSGFRFGF